MEYIDEWVLDLHDAGYWMARGHEKTYPIGRDKKIAMETISELNKMHRPNLGLRGGSLFVCKNENDSGDFCEYEILVEKAT